jgi:hypothetical protein
VKVTVIATGFDCAEVHPPVSSSIQTPVDLQHYTAHLKEKIEVPVPAMEMGRLSIARRPSLDLAPAAAAASGPSERSSAMDAGEMDLESLSAFDVPAFLRREG